MDAPTPPPVEQRFTVGEASNRLGVPAHQLRRWCKYHADHLSPEANPAQPGIERRLTAHDIAVLASVRDMRSRGLTTALINVHLQAVKVGEPANITDAPVAAQDGPQQAQTALLVVDAIQSAMAPLAARIEALEAQRLRFDAVWLGVACFIAGLIVGLAVWWFQ